MMYRKVILALPCLALVWWQCAKETGASTDPVFYGPCREAKAVLRIRPVVGADSLVLGKTYGINGRAATITSMAFILSDFDFPATQPVKSDQPRVMDWVLNTNSTLRTGSDSVLFCLSKGKYNDFGFAVGVAEERFSSTYCIKWDTTYKTVTKYGYDGEAYTEKVVDKISCVEEAGLPYEVLKIKGFYDKNNDGTAETPFQISVNNNKPGRYFPRFHGAGFEVPTSDTVQIFRYGLDMGALFEGIHLHQTVPETKMMINLNNAIFKF